MGSDADGSEIVENRNKYYEMIRDARIGRKQGQTNCTLYPSIVSDISGSGTLCRRPASTWVGPSLSTNRLPLVDHVEYLIGCHQILLGNLGQFPGVMGWNNLFGIEVFLHATKDFLEGVEGAALESVPCFSAYNNESVDDLIKMRCFHLPRAKSAVICLLMTCSM